MLGGALYYMIGSTAAISAFFLIAEPVSRGDRGSDTPQSSDDESEDWAPMGLDTVETLASKYEQSAGNFARVVARHPDRFALCAVAANGDAIDIERKAAGELDAAAPQLNGVARPRFDQRRLQTLLSVRAWTNAPSLGLRRACDDDCRDRGGSDEPHLELPTCFAGASPPERAV